MSMTTDQLRGVLADTFHLYFRSHVFHWNVVGVLFPQLHDFFGKIYTQTWGELDVIAEHIRACGVLAPPSISALMGFTNVAPRESTPGTSKEMIEELVALNTTLLNSLAIARNAAEDEKKRGVVNFLEGLIDAHEKLDWMLKATLQEMS